MAKIKICGLRRVEDIEMVNTYKPDYGGFIIDFPKSFRSLDIEEVEKLTKQLDPDIISVGVFVNEDNEVIRDLLTRKVIQMAQLHGQETEADIQYLKSFGPIIKAFEIHNEEDLEKAAQSSADYVLLDSGKGSGQTFNWQMIQAIDRAFFLAGGLDETNIEQAIQTVHPYAIDISSGVETNRVKDANKIRMCVQKGRKL